MTKRKVEEARTVYDCEFDDSPDFVDVYYSNTALGKHKAL